MDENKLNQLQEDSNKEQIENQEFTEESQEFESSNQESDTEIDDSKEGELINQSLLTGTLGFVNFDSGRADNATTNVMVSAEKRRLFKRDRYVLIKDEEQQLEFLGRIVEGPFHSPHEISTDSAITRTTVLNPERTKFRPSYYVYGTIEVLGQLANDRVTPTPTRPRPYSEITIFPQEKLEKLLNINGDFHLGLLLGYENVLVKTDPENKNFLPRNIGIFGTVGSGKSNTTQVLIEEATKAGWAVIVVDVEGEYVKMNEPTEGSHLVDILKNDHHIKPEDIVGIQDFQVFVPTSGESAAVSPKRFKVPISKLDPYIVGDIQDFSPAQVRMYERIINYSTWQNRKNKTSNTRLGNLAQPNVYPFVSELQNLKNKYQNYKGLNYELDMLIGKYQPNKTVFDFTLQDLVDNLADKEFLKDIRNTEQSTTYTLSSKLKSIGRSGMLDWNRTNRTPYLPVDDLLVGGRLSVLDVSETDDRSRNIAIAYVLQSLFERVVGHKVGEHMENGQPRPKVLMVLEEVHTFVSRSSVSKMRAVLDNLQLISRRGRKRWMSLALVSQQPGHVPDELFELANTRFIHQLKSASNLAPVRQTTGGVHEALWTTMPSLGVGQCLLTGAVFKNPLFVQVRPAKSKREYSN